MPVGTGSLRPEALVFTQLNAPMSGAGSFQCRPGALAGIGEVGSLSGRGQSYPVIKTPELRNGLAVVGERVFWSWLSRESCFWRTVEPAGNAVTRTTFVFSTCGLPLNADKTLTPSLAQFNG